MHVITAEIIFIFILHIVLIQIELHLFIIVVAVTSLTLIQTGQFITQCGRLVVHRLLFAAISGYYYYCIGMKVTAAVRVRKSTSSQNVSVVDK